jgi:hypothetical protein
VEEGKINEAEIVDSLQMLFDPS